MATPSRMVRGGRVRRLAVNFGKRNCELFQALFRASANHNEGQT
jgi:hypothetical protein